MKKGCPITLPLPNYNPQMPDQTPIIQAAIHEVMQPKWGVTQQFLEIHRIVYADGIPEVAKVELKDPETAIVYFQIENEKFHFALYFNLTPELEIQRVYSVPFCDIFFAAYSAESIAALNCLC